jgi:hypothetical protein
MMSKHGEIRRDEHCFDYSDAKASIGKRDKVFTYACHGQKGNQKWQVVNGLIKHESGFCIEIDTDKTGISMQKCDSNNPRQLWKWKKRE